MPKNLSTFLRGARARIDPTSVSIAHGGTRRVPGLRREEVAELAGMSDAWYSRFEAGRARLSLPALARIADVLRLQANERAELFTLARPEIDADASGYLRFEATGVSEMRSIARLLRELRSVSTHDEIAVHTVRAINDCTKPTNVAYWVREIDEAGNSCFEYTEGPAGEFYSGFKQTREASAHERDAVLANRRTGCETLEQSPSPEYRERVGKFGARSYLSLGIGPVGKPWTAVGFANADQGEFSPFTIATLETIGEAARGALFRLGEP